MQKTEIRHHILDMDGTLYKTGQVVDAGFKSASLRTCMSLAKMSEAEALSWIVESKKQFDAYCEVHRLLGIDPVLFHKAFHKNMTTDGVVPDSKLCSVLREKAQGHHFVVLTHGSRTWAQRVLTKLNLADLFPHVLALEDVGMRKKTESLYPFQAALALLGSKPQETAFYDDCAANHKMAHQNGLQTYLVHWGQPIKPQPSYVHAQIYTPADVLGSGVSH